MSRAWLASPGGEVLLPADATPDQAAAFAAAWFDEGVAGLAQTERLPVVAPAAPTAPFVQGDLPYADRRRPLALAPSRWPGLRRWTSEALQVAFGAVLGCGGVFLALALAAWLTR